LQQKGGAFSGLADFRFPPSQKLSTSAPAQWRPIGHAEKVEYCPFWRGFIGLEGQMVAPRRRQIPSPDFSARMGPRQKGEGAA